jgi:tetratricopeptide (TPR) repeat protein
MQRPDEQDALDRLVVSLELADLADDTTRAQLDSTAAKMNNRGLQAAAAWHYATALPMLTAASTIWDRLGRWPGVIAARNTRGAVYRKLGDYAAAADDHIAALAVAHDEDLSGGEITARTLLAAARTEQGDLARAVELLDQALALSTDTTDNWGAGHAQYFLGRAHEERKDWEAALAAYGAALELWIALDAPAEQAEATAGMARIALAQGYTSDAYALAEKVLHHLADNGPARLDEPLRVYWTVYRVLHTMQQADNALKFLGAAQHMLLQQAGELPDDRRAAFLEAVPVNRAIVAAVEAEE